MWREYMGNAIIMCILSICSVYNIIQRKFMKYFCTIWFKKKGQKMNIKNFCNENCLEKICLGTHTEPNGKTNNERRKKSRVKWSHKVEIYCSSETNKYEQGDTTQCEIIYINE